MDYDAYYTIEANGNKGWQVTWTSFELSDAIAELERSVKRDPDVQWRLTTADPALVPREG